MAFLVLGVLINEFFSWSAHKATAQLTCETLGTSGRRWVRTGCNGTQYVTCAANEYVVGWGHRSGDDSDMKCGGASGVMCADFF